MFQSAFAGECLESNWYTLIDDTSASFNPLSLESVWRERFFAQVSVFQAAMSENPPRRCKYFGRKFSKLCKKAFVFLQMTILALRFPRRIVLSLNGLHSF